MQYVVRLEEAKTVIPKGHSKTENRILFESPQDRFTMWVGFLEPGGGAEGHSHSYPQAFYVLEGEGRVEIGQESWQVSSGTAYYAPPSVEHAVTEVGPGGLKVLVFSFNLP